jgi:hydroxymethylbilane synthase
LGGALSELPGAPEVHLEVIKTLGDGLSAGAPDAALPEDVPQGLFTRELDEALLSGRIRAAIHSLKDVPTLLPPGIRYGAIPLREDPRDAVLSRDGRKLFELPSGSKVGTASPRREAQVRAVRSDLRVVPLRGNVDTRLRKLSQGEVDAVVLAAAGLIRLGREGEATEFLDPALMTPSPAQGVLCVTIREGDEEMERLLRPLDHGPTRACALAERSFLKALQGGCRVPVGALGVLKGEVLSLMGVVAHPNGEQVMRDGRKGTPDRPEELGERLAGDFLRHGAKDILEAFGRSFERGMGS